MIGEKTIPGLDPDAVRRRLDRAASTVDEAGFVHAATREGLLARLGPMTLEAGTVIDLGCGTGAARRALQKRFPRALVVGCDRSQAMLARAAEHRRLFRRPALVRARAESLPFADASADLVFANLLLPWVDEVEAVLREVGRVLRRDGLFLFSTLGPDSLKQLRDAWQEIDAGAHVRSFLDMHDVGDAVVRAGLRDPVLDVDRLRVTYGDTGALFADLERTGARNSLDGRRRGLTGRRVFGRFLAALEARRLADVLPIDIEIVYGHCWGSGQAAESGEFLIDPARIGRRGR